MKCSITSFWWLYKVSDSKILLERQSIWFIANLNWRRLSINFGTPSMYVTGKIINALYLSLSSLHFSQFWYSDLESGKWGRGRGKTGRGNNPGHGERCFTVISFISQNTCFSPNNNENSTSAAHTGSISPMIVCWEIRGLGREEGGRSLVDGGEGLDADWLAIPEAVLVIQDCFKVARGLCNLGVKLKRFRSYCGIWNSAFWLVLLFYLCHCQ